MRDFCLKIRKLAIFSVVLAISETKKLSIIKEKNNKMCSKNSENVKTFKPEDVFRGLEAYEDMIDETTHEPSVTITSINQYETEVNLCHWRKLSV